MNKHTDSPITEELYERASSLYDPSASERELESWIYYLTHLIIGDTLFYVVPLSQKKSSLYTHILKSIESEIANNFLWVHLDCKLEFLVCSYLHGYTSYLAPMIRSEANNSLSPEGAFVVDKYNRNPQLHRVTFQTSEHRNALYIMSGYDSIT